MRTEEQIVYELMNIYHGGQVSNDNVISERLMRSFLRKHRARKIPKFSTYGLTITDECFQHVGTIFLEKTKYYYEKKIPAVIYMDAHGIMVTKNEKEIPVMDRMAFRSSLKNILNKNFPKATMHGDLLILFPGKINECQVDTSSDMGLLLKAFDDEIKSFNDNEKVSIDLSAVLYDPSQAQSYDWTKDPYPCPSEIIDEITISTTQTDLGLMLRQYIDNNVNNISEKQPSNEEI